LLPFRIKGAAFFSEKLNKEIHTFKHIIVVLTNSLC